MTVEERHATDNRIGKVHDEIHRAVSLWNVHGIEPFGRIEPDSVLRVGQEMNLMDVKRCSSLVAFTIRQCCIDPTRTRSMGASCIENLCPLIIEGALVLSEINDEVGLR